jgi:hypothetical protein
MADRVQTYKNHARLLPPFHFFVLPVLLCISSTDPAPMAGAKSRHHLGGRRRPCLVDARLIRAVMALKVQDRVIRLEMRMRLAGLLPPDLQSRITDLTPQQLVALRFACDAELRGWCARCSTDG